MREKWTTAVVVAVLAFVPGACKKKEAQGGNQPVVAAPTAPVQPAAKTVEPPKPETPPEQPTKAAPEAPAAPAETPKPEPAAKTEVKGNVKGADFVLTAAYARIEEGNKSVKLVILDKALPTEDFDCNGIDAPGEEYRFLELDLPSGPKADLFAGTTISIDPSEYLRNEGDWSVDDGDTVVTVTSLDLAGKALEGRILIDRKAGEQKGKLEGSFVAAVCTSGDVPFELKPTIAEPPNSPLSWKVAGKTLAYKSAIARLNESESDGQAYWEIYISTGDLDCESYAIEETDYGFDLYLFRQPDGSYPVGHAVPIDDWFLYVVSADVGSKAEDRGDDMDPEETSLMVSEIGTGDDAILKGTFGIEREGTFMSPADESLIVPIAGGGTFEARICAE